MTAVAAASPALPAEAQAFVAKIEAAFPTAAAENKCKNLHCAIIDRQLNVLWSTSVPAGKPGMLAKIVVSKARSTYENQKLSSGPNGFCDTMCCYVCPWMCGCTKQMAVEGAVPVALPGATAETLLVCAGAPKGAVDRAIADRLMGEAAASSGGAPNVDEIAR
jgi:hypothetical protein